MPGENLAHEHKCPRGGEPRHIQPDLRDDGGGRNRSDAGYLIESGRRFGERGQMRLDLLVDGGRQPVDSTVLANNDEVQIGKFRLVFLTG